MSFAKKYVKIKKKTAFVFIQTVHVLLLFSNQGEDFLAIFPLWEICFFESSSSMHKEKKAADKIFHILFSHKSMLIKPEMRAKVPNKMR